MKSEAEIASITAELSILATCSAVNLLLTSTVIGSLSLRFTSHDGFAANAPEILRNITSHFSHFTSFAVDGGIYPVTPLAVILPSGQIIMLAPDCISRFIRMMLTASLVNCALVMQPILFM